MKRPFGTSLRKIQVWHATKVKNVLGSDLKTFKLSY